MTFNKIFRVCVLAICLPVGAMGCDNEGTGGTSPPLSASSGGAEPGAFDEGSSVGGGFSAEAAPVPTFAESPGATPGGFSTSPDVPSGGSGTPEGASCTLANACDEYLRQARAFAPRLCAQAGAAKAACEASVLESAADCAGEIASGETTAAEVCDDIDCGVCVLQNASTLDFLEECSVAACKSACAGTCGSQAADEVRP
jgi:hypothetical protein